MIETGDDVEMHNKDVAELDVRCFVRLSTRRIKCITKRDVSPADKKAASSSASRISSTLATLGVKTHALSPFNGRMKYVCT